MRLKATVVRCLFGATLLIAGAAKLISGTPFVVELLRICDLSPGAWVRAMKTVQAVAAYEIALGVYVLVRAHFMAWWLMLALALLAFGVWDAARYITGGAPDCGCFGGWRIADAWWHVVAKHCVLWACYMGLAIGDRRNRIC